MPAITVSTILQQLLNGFVIGSIFVMVAMGLTIIFGLMGIVNFAHGAFYAVGAYVGLTVLGLVGGIGGGSAGFFLSILIVPVVVGILGAAAEASVIRPLYDRDLIYSLLLTFGLMLVIHELIKIVWGVGGRTFNQPPILNFTVSLGVIDYPGYRLFVVAMTAVIAAAVWLFLHYTDLGMIVRAATENRDMVKVQGINITHIYTLVFAIGTAIAGLAGVLHAPLVSVYPEMGVSIIVQSFVVVVIGGLNSFRGSVAAGVLVGEVRSLTYLIEPQAVDIVIFVLMAVVLLVRPQGLMGAIGGVD
ncbi:MAG: branched-chain amino acid ABC transporter permease [Salinigranum sp.]